MSESFLTSVWDEEQSLSPEFEGVNIGDSYGVVRNSRYGGSCSVFSLDTPGVPLDFGNALPRHGQIRLSYLEDLISLSNYEKGLFIYNIDTKTVQTLSFESNYVVDKVFSKDSKQILLLQNSRNRNIRTEGKSLSLIDTETLNPIRSFPSEDIQIALYDNLVVSVENRSTLKIRDIRTTSEVSTKTKAHSQVVVDFDFSSSGDLYTIGIDHCIKQWKISELSSVWENRTLYKPERLYVTESGYIGIQLESKGIQLRDIESKTPFSFILGHNTFSKSGRKLLQKAMKGNEWKLYNCTLGMKQQKSARF